MRNHDLHRTTSADGTPIAYGVRGEGPPVLFIHGWMATSSVFDDLFEVWPGAGRSSIRLDLRGSGASALAVSDYSIARLADDVMAVIEDRSLEKVALVGHSMGGQIAQYVATQIPARVGHLFLMCPVPAAGLSLPTEVRDSFRSAGGRPESLGKILDMACLDLPADRRARLLEAAVGIAPEVIAQTFDTWTAGGFAEQLPKITAHTTVIATDDPFLPPDLLEREVTSRIAGAKQTVVHGPGHYPTSEAPARMAELLEAAIGEVASS